METEEIVYQESVRAVEQQSSTLDELRTRAAVLLAANGVTSGFFASSRLPGGVGTFGGFAIFGAAVSAALAVYVLLPGWEAWRGPVSARILLEDHVDVEERNTTAQLLRFVAERLELAREHNDREAQGPFRALWWACVVFGVDILLWLLQVSVH